MKNTFERRLREWNNLKHQLINDPEPYWALIRFFDDVPKTNKQSDPWDQSTWPDPWVMVQENLYDSFLVSLGILYTLSLVERWENVNIELWIMIDYQTGDYYYPVVIGDDVINWDGQVTNVQSLPDTTVIETVYVIERNPDMSYASGTKCGPKVLRKIV